MYYNRDALVPTKFYSTCTLQGVAFVGVIVIVICTFRSTIVGAFITCN